MTDLTLRTDIPSPCYVLEEAKLIRNLEKNNRDENIIEDRSNGLSNQQIAKKYNVSIRTVHRSLKKIKPNKNVNLNIKNNIYKKFEIYSSRS